MTVVVFSLLPTKREVPDCDVAVLAEHRALAIQVDWGHRARSAGVRDPDRGAVAVEDQVVAVLQDEAPRVESIGAALAEDDRRAVGTDATNSLSASDTSVAPVASIEAWHIQGLVVTAARNGRVDGGRRARLSDRYRNHRPGPVVDHPPGRVRRQAARSGAQQSAEIVGSGTMPRRPAIGPRQVGRWTRRRRAGDAQRRRTGCASRRSRRRCRRWSRGRTPAPPRGPRRSAGRRRRPAIRSPAASPR